MSYVRQKLGRASRRNPLWVNINGAFTYFKLRKGARIGAVDSLYPIFVKKYVAADWAKAIKTSWEDLEKKGGSAFFRSQRLTDIHLYSDFRNEIEPNSNIQFVYLFSGIGLLTIVLACINFINLATARAATRAKEIGIRKTIGALKKKLITQFLLESFFYTSLSAIFGLAIVSAFLVPFNFISGKDISVLTLVQPQFILGVAFLVIVVSIVAGGHPAFLLTSFKPTAVLKGDVNSIVKGANLRRGLVVFQFCISLALAICSIIVYQQVVYIQNKTLGFNKENILRINNVYQLGKNLAAFKDELLTNSGVINASYSHQLPPEIKEAYAYLAEGTTPAEHLASFNWVDYDHLATLGLQMAKGRFFSRDFPSDSLALVINEQAAADLGYQDFVGRRIISDKDTFHIIGIIKDFHLQGVQSPIKPLVLGLTGPKTDVAWRLAVHLSTGDLKAKVEFIEQLWKKFANSAIDYSFLDQEFDAQYRAEQKMESVFFVFTVLALTIACLGLFGLTTFTAQQRTKEIGIRKVMGASVQQIVVLLSTGFLRLVAFALLLALPISWYAMTKWLQTFAYRIDFSLAVAVGVGFAVVIVALLTVSLQTIRAAEGNPVTNLRSE
jgi:putative ABC transport system permease protein